MEVWKCNNCEFGPCIFSGGIYAEGTKLDVVTDECYFTGNKDGKWELTDSYEIIEHKPDYNKMAEES